MDPRESWRSKSAGGLRVQEIGCCGGVLDQLHLCTRPSRGGLTMIGRITGSRLVPGSCKIGTGYFIFS